MSVAKTEVSGWQPGVEFRDRQRSGPFDSWEHVHRMEPTGPNSCVLEDRIT